jgi:hypothetical protein
LLTSQCYLPPLSAVFAINFSCKLVRVPFVLQRLLVAALLACRHLSYCAALPASHVRSKGVAANYRAAAQHETACQLHLLSQQSNSKGAGRYVAPAE